MRSRSSPIRRSRSSPRHPEGVGVEAEVLLGAQSLIQSRLLKDEPDRAADGAPVTDDVVTPPRGPIRRRANGR